MSLVSRIDQVTSWQRVLDAARRTVGKKPLNKEPSTLWKRRILLAEHSPIRLLEFDFTWEDIRQWVTVHLVRHHEGCEKFVHTQREDRRDLGVPRDELPQGSLNDMDMTCNAQALINISRRRLCYRASPETRAAWKQVKEAVAKIDPEMASAMVPDCIYRGGFCAEPQTCGWYRTENAQKMLQEYHSPFPDRQYTPVYVSKNDGKECSN